MMKRSEDMKLMENYRIKLRYLGLPKISIFDEYVAFMAEMLGTKEKRCCPQQIKTNRYAWAAGWFLPDSRLPASDAKYLGTESVTSLISRGNGPSG